MSDPFRQPGWAFNRYMLSFAVSTATTLFALLPPLASLAGWIGPGVLAAAGYGVMLVAVVAELCRLGASRLKAPALRRACLAVLQGLLWSVVVLALPALILDVIWLSGHGPQAGPPDERHVFAVIAVVFGLMATAAAINLALLLRSSFWAAFRTFVSGGEGAEQSAASRR